MIGQTQVDQRTNYITHVRETAALLAVAVHSDWFVAQRLPDKTRYDHAVLTGLPRTHCVEQADHHGRHALLAPVSNGQELIDRLRAGITPAPARRGSEHQVAILTERQRGALAVHFG